MRKVKFEDVATRVNTREDKDNTSLLYYVGGDHIESGEMVVHNRGLIEGSTIGPMFYFGFKKGDILLVSRNPHLRKAAMVNFDGICSEKTFVIGSKDENVLLQRYLAVVVQTESFWNYCEEHKSGGVNFFVNWSTLAKYEFELPDIEEQRIISDKVWAAYEVKECYRKLISATDELVKSRFIEMFGNPLSPDQKYPLKRLGDCVEINPRRGALSLNDSDLVSFVPMPSVSEEGHLQDLSDVEFGKVKKGFTYFKNGDVLFAKITPCMENGKGAIAEGLTNDTGMGSTEFHILRPIEGRSSAFWALALTRLPVFREKAAKNMTGTGGQKRVPSSFLADFPIGLPPIYEQNRFAEIYKQADKSKFELKQAIEKIDKVMRALLQ
jgi:type I restriction enzyme S subunit